MKAKLSVLLLLCLIFTLVFSLFAYSAPPTGPESYTNISTQRRSNFNNTPMSIPADAGNITKMTINITSITEFWQGYYGNVSGHILLDDTNNFTFYDWFSSNVSLTGNLFAANESIANWLQVECLNLTSNGTNKSGGGLMLNETILEESFGMTPNLAEGFGETFSATNNITIDSIALNFCPATVAYSNDVKTNGMWNQTLLTINNTHSLIFATNLENDKVLFNNERGDFQLLVADRNAAGVTNYLLYVELV